MATKTTKTPAKVPASEVEVFQENETTSLHLPDDMNLEEWKSLGSKLSFADRQVKWFIGDWINHGMEQFHDGLQVAAEVLSHLASDTIVRYGRMSLAFTEDRRRSDLEWSHFKAVAQVNRYDPKAADSWLERAAEEELTTRELQSMIQHETKAEDQIRKSRMLQAQTGKTAEQLEAERVAHVRAQIEAYERFTTAKLMKRKDERVRIVAEADWELLVEMVKAPKPELEEVASDG